MKKTFFVIVVIFLFLSSVCYSDNPTETSSSLTYSGELEKSMVATDVFKFDNNTFYVYYTGMGLKMMKTTDFENFEDMELDVTSLQDGKGFQANTWVFRAEDKIKMVYEEQYDNGTRQLYISESSDGVKFTNPYLIIAGDSEDIDPHSGTVFLSVPDGIIMDNNIIRMYFVSDGSDIRSAVSYDNGSSWVKDNGTRIYNGTDPCIFQLPSGGYRMIYTNWEGIAQAKSILYADSEDGLNFGEGKVLLNIIDSEQYIDYVLIDPEFVEVSENTYKLLVTLMNNSNGETKLLIYDINKNWLSNSSDTQESCASFDSETMLLHIPFVDVGNGVNYWLDLKLTDVDKLKFQLVDYKENVENNTNIQSGNFDYSENKLFVPCLNLNNVNYFLELNLVDVNTLTFMLTNMGTNTD